ncbi:hypothetical protein E3U55_13605 [Filobacillus milosensis]|uniref:DUF3994 domain-containing protein n=1 Tax=Filobacillus milosensis TaxID=94137 RepID=A0A4Y8IEJ3_9BACI|nr:hypothetical protein [Filobacillus milosensis]TFB14656.1 hypothetical protein E3U55_13605 [Filobacillus milosensis]
MKKLLSITLLIGVLIIAGCGQSATGETDDPTSVDEENQTEQDESNGSQSDDKENKEGKDSNNSKDEPSSQDNEQNENTEDEGSENQDNEKEKNDTESIDQGRAKTVLTEYEEAFKKVVSYTNDQGKQKEYTTKEGLKEHFMHFMSDELATSMVDTYFEEKEDGLYVKAMDGPTFLQEDKEFSFTQNKDGSVSIIQERNNELTGHVEMEYKLVNKNGYWIVNEVESRSLESNNEG